jgi:dolichol-phosphate mannosyltransferase
MTNSLFIAVVIPCYKVKNKVLNVIQKCGPEVSRIYVIDDCCPENTGNIIKSICPDPRVKFIFHSNNMGVGGATITGYKQAIADGADVIVKIDGDGQMDPAFLPNLIIPILSGDADYVKGNRFYNLEDIANMPRIRVLGNSILSLFSKFSTGYWHLFDPTNGYTAIHAGVAKLLPFKKISKRFFFESDMLFRLSLIRANVVDMPMAAKYDDEISNLSIRSVSGEFLVNHIKNKRIFYNYYLRDMSIASLELPIGVLLFTFGCFYGGYSWLNSVINATQTPAGTVMLSALPILTGFQLVLAFLNFDIQNTPRYPIHKMLK